jgi:uncharacterized protein YbaR (Trm112 family)/SAM-dependent methyltransferase
MRQRAADLVVCPLDRTPLELVAWSIDERPLSEADRAKALSLAIDPRLLEIDVITGVLVNRARRICYPIVRGIPRLLTFPTAVGEGFLKEHGGRLAADLPGVRLPDGEAAPGELDVLRTFSREWLDYRWDEHSYWNLPAAAMFRCMDFMLDVERHPLSGKRVLEVGIGIGGIADHVARTHDCELVGVDLGYAVDAAARNFGINPFFHIVQASAFAPPFRASTFDLVYSQGVIHHTYSTRTAFDHLQELPKVGGRLYIWVYSPENESRSLARRAIMLLEHMLRPICSRLPERLQTLLLLPIVPLYMAHQRLVAGGAIGAIRYGFNEALHAARDRFTPRYIHRHNDAEVMGWFRACGYQDIRAASGRDVPPWLPIGFYANTGIDGTRR